MAEEGANISDSPFSQTETWAGFDQRPYFSYTFERLATWLQKQLYWSPVSRAVNRGLIQQPRHTQWVGANSGSKQAQVERTYKEGLEEHGAAVKSRMRDRWKKGTQEQALTENPVSTSEEDYWDVTADGVFCDVDDNHCQ